MSIFRKTLRFDGTPRKVGVELEYTGLGLEDSVKAVRDVFGGHEERLDRYRYRMTDTPLGDFTVELDMKLMHQLQAKMDDEPGNETQVLLSEAADTLLNPFVTRLSPTEIITPPLLEEDLPKLETLVGILREKGAKGTGASMLNAYGLHLNIDLPALDAPTITAYLQAFALLQDWLIEEMEMDLTRYLAQYAKPFPEAYAKHILQPDYQPSMEQLIGDYLDFNPSRDRALDMLPLFAYLDEPQVRSVVKDGRVKARPTFHFRLPNCRLDEPHWTVESEARYWSYVERLAEDETLRRRMADAFLADTERLMHRFDHEWQEQTAQWLAGA